MFRRPHAAIAAALLAVAAGSPQAAPAPQLKVVSQATAIATPGDQLVVRAARLRRDFAIDISPPLTAPPAGQTVPVIYALDGGYGIAGPEARLLGGIGQAMAPAYVVSISYVGGQPILRNTDFMHHTGPLNGETIGGGGEAFQAFLLDELRPFIEKRYPVDPRRAVLFGHSLGGLFAANLIATRPDAFAGYIIGSPSVWIDRAVVQAVAKAAGGASGRVFVGVGEAEGPAMISDANLLAGALGAGFTVRGRVFAGASHLSYYPQLAAEGFAYVLPPTRP